MHKNPKIHFPHIQLIVGALDSIFIDEFYADKVLTRVFKSNPALQSPDHAFIAETTYDVVRWWRLLNACVATSYGKDENHLFNILSAYLFLFKNTKATWHKNAGLDFALIEKSYQETQQIPAIRHSVADWMYALLTIENVDVDAELAALNKAAAVVLRANTLKTTVAQLSRNLAQDGIEHACVASVPGALVLAERQNIFKHKNFLEGLFEVQDAGSQCIADFVQAEPRMRVIDACAGAGGKSLAIAAQMENKGKVLSLDIEKHKLDELMRRAKRAGAGNIEAREITSTKTIKRLINSADRVLLDVPCTGLGTLRRNPDLKWKLKESYVNEVKEKQKNILQSYSRMVKPGGKLVYATCSILPSENQDQVQLFLSNNANFKLEKQQTLLPSVFGFDGFYMARLEKLS